MDERSLVPWAAAGGLAALAVRAFLIEPASVEVSRYPLPLPALPEEWRGARVVHLTDLHYGNPRSDRLFEWMVGTVNGIKPDLVLVTGDFVVRRPCEVEPCARYVARLHSRHGVLAVLGDHDFRRKTRQPIPGVPEALREAGVRLLRNETIELPGGLRVAGVDPSTYKVRCADLSAALAGGVEPPHLLLSHAPDIISEAAGRVPMVLCGHTHGGQVVIPLFGPPITHSQVDRRFASGWSDLKGTRMYTGRGLASHFSLRFCCRPEVTVFTLARSGEATAGGRDPGSG